MIGPIDGLLHGLDGKPIFVFRPLVIRVPSLFGDRAGLHESVLHAGVA